MQHCQARIYAHKSARICSTKQKKNKINKFKTCQLQIEMKIICCCCWCRRTCSCCRCRVTAIFHCHYTWVQHRSGNNKANNTHTQQKQQQIYSKNPIQNKSKEQWICLLATSTVRSVATLLLATYVSEIFISLLQAAMLQHFGNSAGAAVQLKLCKYHIRNFCITITNGLLIQQHNNCFCSLFFAKKTKLL